MIERLYIKNNLSFSEVDIEFDKGLIVFTGASGTGKSILFDAMLAIFGLKNPEAEVAEITLNSEYITKNIDSKEDDLLIFKQIKKEKNRYLINNQTASKEHIKNLSKQFIGFLGFKNSDFFNSEAIIDSFDEIIKSKDSLYVKLMDEYLSIYNELITAQNILHKLEADERKSEETKEYLKFEISKITSINPTPDEYQELSNIKKELSKKDKLEKVIFDASKIFDTEQYVQSALSLMDIKSDFFDDALNELREHFEKTKDKLAQLDETNIEEVLDRISDLSSLNKRFGSIQEALIYKQEKENELKEYENITFKKTNLQNDVKQLSLQVAKLADEITVKRIAIAKTFTTTCNKYLKSLQLNDIAFILSEDEISKSGKDTIKVQVNRTNIENLSSGELNRTKLAFLVTKSEYINENGVLILDEVDANLSGLESQSVAKVLQKLSINYQIFSISHQPQLSALANQHFLVTKIDNKSSIILLSKEQRVEEIARMISGETIEQEAIEFAKKAITITNLSL
jgi:DNA repair protein RecN (Recombination protein N)